MRCVVRQEEEQDEQDESEHELEDGEVEVVLAGAEGTQHRMLLQHFSNKIWLFGQRVAVMIVFTHNVSSLWMGGWDGKLNYDIFIALTMLLSKIPSNPFHCKRMAFAFTTKQAPLRLPSFTHFPLYPSVFKYLQANNIHTPTFIQYALLASLAKQQSSLHHITSPTGSGKTLSYLLPTLSQLKKDEQGAGVLTAAHRPRAIILTANKELVLQCRNVGKQVSHHCKLRVQGIGIGRPLTEENRIIEEGVDVLVSTFQRIKPLIEKKLLFFSNVKWMVVDEVDTLYQMGKLPSIMEHLLIGARKAQEKTPLEIILSGTTRSQELVNYLHANLGQITEITDKKTHLNLQNIKHEFLQCQSLDKHDTLISVLKQRQGVKTLVFCNTIKSLHELQYFLQDNKIPSISLHSDLQKQARLQNYQLFRDGQAMLMLSTDLGARGLDIPHLERVINYDFPLSTCDYLQRAGRTGRAGKEGQVVTLYHRKNLDVINQLKDASFSQPIRVNNSAYRMRNREEKR